MNQTIVAAAAAPVMGQSRGGFLSITLGADPRIKTIGVFNCGLRTNTNWDVRSKGIKE